MTTCPVCHHDVRTFDCRCNQCGALLNLSTLPQRVVCATPEQVTTLEQLANGELTVIPEEFKSFLKSLGVEVE